MPLDIVRWAMGENGPRGLTAWKERSTSLCQWTTINRQTAIVVGFSLRPIIGQWKSP